LKTSITFEFEEGDGACPRDYIDPGSALVAISEITGYMREIDKYGMNGASSMTPEAVIDVIRRRVRDICEDIPQEWKQ
jgi:hypothetical protein